MAIYINNDSVGTRLDQKYYTVTEIKNGSDKGKWSVTFSKQIIDSSANINEQLDLNSNEVNRIIVKIVKDATAHDEDGNKVTDGTEISAK